LSIFICTFVKNKAMKRLFIYLLKKYSTNEKDRISILRVLDEQVQNEYTEQTGFGNVYNGFSEFVLASSFTRERVNLGEDDSVEILKSGINSTFNETITMLKDNG
jgi:hypothetical protein